MKETGFGFLNISQMRMHRYEAERDWVGSGKKEYTNELIFSLDGECVVTVEDNSYIIKPNMLVVFPHNRTYSHRLTSKRRFSYYQCHFYGEIDNVPLFDAVGIDGARLAVEVADRGSMIALFEGALHDESFSDEVSMWLNRCASGIKIISEYIRLLKQANPTNDAQVFNSVTDYMKQSLAHSVSVKELAALVNLEPSYFIRKFTKDFGCPPMKYFDLLRVRRAMSMLENTDMQIGDIGCAVGIEDKYYFNKFFARHCDMTPMEYRKLFRS